MTVGIVHRDAQTAEFFDAAARGELLIRRCGACGAFNAPQVLACEHCQSDRQAWAVAAGTGTVVSWTVVHGRARGDAPPSRTSVAIVELDEGPWLHARLTGLEPEAITAGLKVAVAFERPEGGEPVPTFRPR
ncbi:hypothetical protein EDD29_5610 [Actinocorallia herbida]|uniref:OB-fold protein n=1 Tax=Actinocorallia herbida TaxID=58109 RepID=A0A3N1D363_9ACTN|nr:OB-fold domain-containing protein [Actinocorallia herbida]ROO87961.1 hypothetical protein EDD29_5610 [Actinocorallia herbida]